MQKSWVPANAQSDSLRLVNIGVRMIEAVELGRKTSVPFADGDEKIAGTHFEVTVTKVTTQPTVTAAGKPPAGCSR